MNKKTAVVFDVSGSMSVHFSTKSDFVSEFVPRIATELNDSQPLVYENTCDLYVVSGFGRAFDSNSVIDYDTFLNDENIGVLGSLGFDFKKQAELSFGSNKYQSVVIVTDRSGICDSDIAQQVLKVCARFGMTLYVHLVKELP